MFNESDDDLDIDEEFNNGTLCRGLNSYSSFDFLQQIDEGERSTINQSGAFNDTDSGDELLQDLDYDCNDDEIRRIIDDAYDGNDPMNVAVASIPVVSEPISDVVALEPINIELQSLLNDIRQCSGMNHPNVSDHVLVFVLLATFIPLLSSLLIRPHSNNDLLTDVIYHIERQNPSSRISKLEAQKAAVPDDKTHKRKNRPCGLTYEKKKSNDASNQTKAVKKKGHHKKARRKKSKKKADDDGVTKIAKNCHRDFDGNGDGSCGGLISV